MKRIDSLLVEHKLFESRSRAQAAIEEGLVLVDGKKIKKATEQFIAEDFKNRKVQILKGAANRYVSRGGLKLEGAIKHTQCVIVDKVVLDVGISTGGFTDCLLKNNAKFVVGIDVGTYQVHDSLKDVKNLKYFENTNFKELTPAFLKNNNVPHEFDLIVGDVSFISMTLLLPQMVQFLKPSGEILFLVKPQFELDSTKLSKKGVVKDTQNYLLVEEKIKNKMVELKLKVLDYFESPILGGEGNKEFFVYAKYN